MKYNKVRALLIGAFALTLTLGSGVAMQGKSNTDLAEQTVTAQAEVDADATGGDIEVSAKAKNMTPTVKAGVSSILEPITEVAAEEHIESDCVIAQVNNYLYVRATPDAEGEVLGKMYRNAVGAQIGREGDWIQMTSGNVTGYVNAAYVKTGDEARSLADEVGIHLATVNTTTLKVRMEPTTEAKVLGLVPDGDVLTVSEATDGWVKVTVEEGEGYVSTDYVNLEVKNEVAESREEEEARLKREEEERLAAQAAAEAARRAEEAAAQAAAAKAAAPKQGTVQQAPQTQSAPSKSTSTGSVTGNSTSTKPQSGSTSTNQTSGSGTQGNTELGAQIAVYAQQFVGNPYVYGGTSLTNGADCSGFVQSVYKNFGISLPRTSGAQGACGTNVGGIGNAKAGDLVWYSGHIGIYIGNGQIVHASSAKTGIKISNASYRTILSVRRIV